MESKTSILQCNLKSSQINTTVSNKNYDTNQPKNAYHNNESNDDNNNNQNNGDQNSDCFEDANEEFYDSPDNDSTIKLPKIKGESREDNSEEEESEKSREENREELRQRLEETTVILRKALNNEFIHSLELCSRR